MSGTDTTSPRPAPAPETARNREVIRTLYEAADKGDLATITGLLADDVVLIEAANHPAVVDDEPGRETPGIWRGRDDVLAGIGNVFAAIGLTGVDLHGVVADGDRVVALLDFHGTDHLGRPYSMPLAEAFRLVDGHVVEILVHYFDMVELRARAGVPVHHVHHVHPVRPVRDRPDTDGGSAAAVSRRLIRSLADADLDGVLRELADDFVMEMPAAPRGADRVIAGRDAVATLVGHVTTTWKRVSLLRLEVHPLAEDPNRVVAEYALEGTNLDDSTYRNEYTSVITVRDGKATRFVEYFDPAPIERALDALRAHLRATRTA